MTYHSTYCGRTVWHNTAAGYALRWIACADCGQLAADTLQGIRRLIRAAVER